MSEDEGGTMSAAEVARLAGVGRAAVSNWRRRHPEFPQPASGSPANPLFARSEVEEWLTRKGKGDQLATSGQTAAGARGIRRREATATTPPMAATLARVMVSLLPGATAEGLPDEQQVVLDPACAQGTLLMAVADRFGDRARLVGQEVDETAAALAAVNLRGHALHPPYEIHSGDAPPDRSRGTTLRDTAAVVCEPPTHMPPGIEMATDPRWEFGAPPTHDTDLAWVQHCYAQLRRRAVAVVAVAPRTCVQPSGQQVRAALVRSGALRSVIALPPGMGSRTGTDVYLWVLDRDAPLDEPVRMIDLTDSADPADVPMEFAAWQRLIDAADPRVARAVARVELLDGETDLRPTRHLSARLDLSAGDLAGVTDRLQALHALVGRGLPRFAGSLTPIRHSFVTLAELERMGALAIRPRNITPRAGDVLSRTLGRAPVVASGTAEDDVGVAQVIELDPTRLDPHFVATFLASDAAALPVANTLGALNREDLRRCRIPRLPLAEQHRYGASFRQLRELQVALRILAAVGSNVIDQTIHGLTTGAVIPDVTEGEPSHS